MVDLPSCAKPSNTLFLLMRLFLHTLIGMESIKEIPLPSPKQQVFIKTDAGYAFANIVLLGDYNDDLDESIGTGPSTYSSIISDGDFDGITITLSESGLRPYIFQDNVIDHITISNELYDNYLEGSEGLFILSI